MKKHLTILFSLAVLFFIPLTSFAQQQDSLIQLYPTLGDTISRFEKEFYNLYNTFPGFEEATVYIRNNDSLISKITYITEHGEEKDTTLVQPLFMLGRTRIYIHNLSKFKEEELRENKSITVTTTDGNELTGNLCRIDNNKMILYAPTINLLKSGYELGGSLITLPKNQIKSVFIPGESNIGNLALWGGVGGVIIGAALGFLSRNDPPKTKSDNWWADLLANWVRMIARQKAVYYGIVFGLIGAATGLIVGLISSSDDQLIEIKSDEDYDKLKYEFNDLTMVLNSHNEKSYTLNLK